MTAWIFTLTMLMSLNKIISHEEKKEEIMTNHLELARNNHPRKGNRSKSRRPGYFPSLASSPFLRYGNTTTALLTIHAPDLHLSVVCPRYNKGHGGVEGGPVYSTIMALLERQGESSNPKHSCWCFFSAIRALSLRALDTLRQYSTTELFPQPSQTLFK